MFKKIVLLKIMCSLLSAHTVAATYKPIDGGPSPHRSSVASLLDSLRAWVNPSEPPVVVPIFRPVSRELTIEEQRHATLSREKGGFYLAGYYKGFPKDVNKGLELINEAAQCGEASACYALAGYFRRGQYGLPKDPDLADAYDRNAKWDEPGKPLVVMPATSSAPASTAEEATSRRTSGDSNTTRRSSGGGGEGSSDGDGTASVIGGAGEPAAGKTAPDGLRQRPHAITDKF